METKTVTGMIVKTNDAQGIVDAVFSVYGLLDLQGDVAHPGMFKRTFRERGNKVKILDNHKATSVLDVLGKPLVLKELARNELPYEIQAQHPEALGGAFASIQFLLDTPEGEGAYIRLRDKAISEWSWGFDAVKVSYKQVPKNGKTVTVRVLEDVELYEISPVLWGAQPVAMTVSAKSHRRRLDPLVQLALFEREWEKLEFGGKTRTQLLTEILLEQDEIAKLL